MLSLLSCKAIDTVFSGVFIPAIVILSVAVLISTSNMYKSSSSFYWDIFSSLMSLLTFLIEYITGFGLIVLPYISIL